MTPQSRGKTAKTAVFRHRWQAWQVVRSIAAVRQRPRTPRNWRCSFTFFKSFLWHFNEKQRGEVIFRHSRPVSCKNQENGAGKQWSVLAPLKILPKARKRNSTRKDVGKVNKEKMLFHQATYRRAHPCEGYALVNVLLSRVVLTLSRVHLFFVSVQDCPVPSLCPPLPSIPVSHPFTILGLDGVSFMVMVAYVLLLVVVVIYAWISGLRSPYVTIEVSVCVWVWVCVCVCATMKRRCQTNGKHDKRYRRYFK